MFFETIEVKPINDEIWFIDMLGQMVAATKEGSTIHYIQNEIEEKFFDLYDLNSDERILIKSQASS